MMEIASYVASIRAGIKSEIGVAGDDHAAEGSQSKKRKLDNLKDGKGPSTKESTHANMNGTWKSPIQFADISFTIPQRKKMTLEMGTSKNEGIRAFNTATKAPEGAIPYSQIGKFTESLLFPKSPLGNQI